MARITVEDCLKKVNNRFSLIHLAAKRVRQLRKGAEPLIVSKNRDIVIALREVAAGKIYPPSEEETTLLANSQDQMLIAEGELPALDEDEKLPSEAAGNAIGQEVTSEGN